ncbi:hypothetical protein C8Q70DRAFT_319170 [Cubamyces menziesii]|nr:hypothetical protein C8Q70DRAFT_319170 [Cubamyces menziesii]
MLLALTFMTLSLPWSFIDIESPQRLMCVLWTNARSSAVCITSFRPLLNRHNDTAWRYSIRTCRVHRATPNDAPRSSTRSKPH